MKMTLAELRIYKYGERIQRCKEYFLYEVLRHSNEWLTDYINKQVDCFNKNCVNDPDEADYFAEIHQEEVHDFELVDYNIVGSMIVSIMSIFEQQCKEQGVDAKSVGDKIIEYRELANVIKHGKFAPARAYNTLKSMASKFIKQDANGLYINTHYKQLNNGMLTLDYSHTDFEECCDLLIKFWENYLSSTKSTRAKP